MMDSPRCRIFLYGLSGQGEWWTRDLIDPLGLHVREPDISTNTQRLGNAAAVLNHLSTNHQVMGQCVISLHNNLLDGNGSAARWARRE